MLLPYNLKMKQIKHPGSFIREKILKPRNLTISALAQLLEVNRSNLSNLINGKISLSKDMASKLESSFGISAENLLTMQLEFDSEQQCQESVNVKARTYVAPFLEIHANDIELTFTNSIDMRARLAVFLRILIHSTTGYLSKVDFPGFEDSQRPGWDGWVETQLGSAWVPEGLSGWEFGVDRDIKTKADKDFAKSVKENSEELRLATVFIFITPRRWSNKKKWIEAKKKLNLWKDVIAYDSSDLEQWVEQSIEAQVWLANQNKVPSHGVRTLKTCWADWANVTDPELPGSLFSTQVKKNIEKIEKFLTDHEKKNLIIAADSIEEGIAFLSQAFNQIPQHQNRILVFDEERVLPRLLLGKVNFIPVIHSFSVAKEFAPYSSQVKSILIYPRNYTLEIDIQLEPLDRRSFKEALKDISIEDDWIDDQYRRSAGSLTILRRQLAVLPTIRSPEWVNQKDLIESLIPLVLIGAWDEKNESDKEVLSLLAGKPYEEIEKDINNLLSINDSPLWAVVHDRGVVSKVDSLFAISRKITATQLRNFFDIAQLILSEDDPILDLPDHLRWCSTLYGKTREFSLNLRKGIAETFVLLAVHGDFLFSSSLGVSCEELASRTIRNILLPLNSRKLEANRNELPIYAEAAPNTFLTIIEDDLKTETPELMTLLRSVNTGYLGVFCPRAGLLWALELLAWNDNFLPRVVIVLAKLSQFEINDNWSNKPINSLSHILDKWMPQTAASLDERIAVFEQLFSRYPEIAWQVAMQQFIFITWVGEFTCRPKWRRDSYNHGLCSNVQEGQKFMEYLFNKVITRKTYSVEMLCDLVSKLRSMNETQQEKVWEVIDNWVSIGQNDKDLAQLRERIRVSVLARKIRKSALEFEFPQFTVKAFEVYKKLQPKNIVFKNLWLFENQWVRDSAYESLDEKVDYIKREKYVKELRINALFEIFNKEGAKGILRLAQAGNASYVIGSLLVEAEIIDVEVIKKIILNDEIKDNELLKGMLETLKKDCFNQLLEAILLLANDSQLLKFLLLSPYDKNTWQAVDKASSEVKTQYWLSIKPPCRYFDLSNFEFGATKLLSVNRPIAAFNSIELDIEQISPQLIYKLLEAIPESSELNASQFQIDRYGLERALKVINESPNFSLQQKANLEMLYIRQLSVDPFNLTRTRIPNLEKYVELHPEFFAYLVCSTYKRDDLKDENNSSLSNTDVSSCSFLLNTLKRIPGCEEGDIDKSIEKLLNWVNLVIECCERQGRCTSAYRCIGKLLSKSLNGTDGIWPNEQVRGFLEKFDQEDVVDSMRIGRYNNRGPVWRDQGGKQEWQLAKQYSDWADELMMQHFTVVTRLLRNLAKLYESEAKEFDLRQEKELRLSYD